LRISRTAWISLGKYCDVLFSPSSSDLFGGSIRGRIYRRVLIQGSNVLGGH
jgi:hypothetical protein